MEKDLQNKEDIDTLGEMENSSVKPSIKELFKGKTIFMTGATGFVGKVLTEKLLRSLPDLSKIYLLVRSRRGKTATERWDDIVSNSYKLFDIVKPILADKIVIVEGDIELKGLGMSEEDRVLLEKNVDFVIHAAANVKFKESFKDIVLSNLRGTHEVVKLALGIKKLKCFVHVSTAFSNSFQTDAEEKIYPAPADWREVITIAETLDERQLQILSQKYSAHFPNSYVLTKNLAENMIWDYREQLPALILRPSIVTPIYSEPTPGWCDSIFGIVGILTLLSTGVQRISLTGEDGRSDFIPVDFVAKSIIVSAWKRTLSPKFGDVQVYNCTSYKDCINNKQMYEILESESVEYPRINNLFWVPSKRRTTNILWFRINAILLHLLPALIVDSCLKAAGKKEILMKIQKQIMIALMTLKYFMLTTFNFRNDKCVQLVNELLPEEKEEFGYDFSTIDWAKYLRGSNKLAKKIFFKEDEDVGLEKARIRYRRMVIADNIITASLSVWIGYMAYSYFAPIVFGV